MYISRYLFFFPTIFSYVFQMTSGPVTKRQNNNQMMTQQRPWQKKKVRLFPEKWASTWQTIRAVWSEPSLAAFLCYPTSQDQLLGSANSKDS